MPSKIEAKSELRRCNYSCEWYTTEIFGAKNKCCYGSSGIVFVLSANTFPYNDKCPYNLKKESKLVKKITS